MVKIGALVASIIAVCSVFANASSETSDGQEAVASNGTLMDAPIEGMASKKSKSVTRRTKKLGKPKTRKPLIKEAEKMPVSEAEIVKDTPAPESSQGDNVPQSASTVQSGGSLSTCPQRSSLKKPIVAKRFARKLHRKVKRHGALEAVMGEEPKKRRQRLRRITRALSSARRISAAGMRRKKPNAKKQNNIDGQPDALDPKHSNSEEDLTSAKVDVDAAPPKQEQEEPRVLPSTNGSHKRASLRRSAKLVINASKPEKAVAAAKKEEAPSVFEPKAVEVARAATPAIVSSQHPALTTKATKGSSKRASTNGTLKVVPMNSRVPNPEWMKRRSATEADLLSVHKSKQTPPSSLAITVDKTAEEDSRSKEQREKLFESIQEGQLQKTLHLTPPQLTSARSRLTPPSSPRSQPSSPRSQPSSPRSQPSSPRSQPSSPKSTADSDDVSALQSNPPSSPSGHSSSSVLPSTPSSPSFAPQSAPQPLPVPSLQAPVAAQVQASAAAQPQALPMLPQQQVQEPVEGRIWAEICEKMVSNNSPAVFQVVLRNYPVVA